MTDPWSLVADEGTDPWRLGVVIDRAAHDTGSLRRAVQTVLDAGGTVADGLAEIVDGATLPLPGGSLDTTAAAWAARDVRVALAADPGDPWHRRWPGWRDQPWFSARRGQAHPVGPAVAIVGMRRATPYGEGIAAWLAESCGNAGARVVSGGAVGIDAAAHRAAIATPGGTTVVLGCGHAVAYPRPHAEGGRLFDQIVAAGGTILSESLPDGQPKPHRVRARNRLVAALVDVVVVVEGGERSGALLTATAAADLGVPVLAVPGDIRASGSAAPHRLLAEGAEVCRGPDDVLSLLDGVTPVADDSDGGAEGRGLPFIGGLPDPAVVLLMQRWPRPVTIEDLAAVSRIDAGALLGAVTRARVDGVLAQGPTGIRLSRRPA